MRKSITKENMRLDWMTAAVWIVVFAWLFCALTQMGGSITAFAENDAPRTGRVANASTGVNVRSGAGTGYSVLVSVSVGTQVAVLGETLAQNDKIWYQISFTLQDISYTGWICGDYLEIDGAGQEPPGEGTAPGTDAAYMQELIAAGFPESYAKPLALLHQKYPDWKFIPIPTGLDWSDAVKNESVTGRNLVQNTVNDSRKSTDPTAYNWSTNQWYGFDGADWVCASSEYIAYCMDPRNFLNEDYIFQFETLEYEEYQTAEGVSNILENTFMAGSFADTDGIIKGYADTFAEIGKSLEVSPYHLASRCKQEQGDGKSPLISGTYSGYNGYFNHFNIGAYTTSTASSIINGLEYARKMGWDSIYKSLRGGSEVISDRYVKKGQNTVYFEKFNVVNASNLYTHQYMTNVMAAFTEGNSIGRAYKNKNTGFVFRIPVYLNMPETAVSFVDRGNPNNWLSALLVSGHSLTPSFQPSITEYSLIVAEGTDSVAIEATSVAGKSAVTGTGSYSLNYGENRISITCISQAGTSRSYNINIVRGQKTPDQPETPGEGSIIVADNASISTPYHVDEIVTGIAPQTSVDAVLSNISAVNCNVKILKADGAENTGIVGTGDKVTVYVNGNVVKQYDIVIYGDINGDGKISNIDLVMLQKQILGIVQLSGAYEKAADIGRDGRVSNLDIVLLQKHILNISQIINDYGGNI